VLTNPVCYVPPAGAGGRPGFWVLTRHADVFELYRDQQFSSDRGNVLDTLAG